MAFLVLLVLLALLATFDPWYRAIVHPRPWLGYVFFVVSIFAALNVALPLVGLPPIGALLASAFVASVAITPVVRRAGDRSWVAGTAGNGGARRGRGGAGGGRARRGSRPRRSSWPARRSLRDVLDLDNIEALLDDDLRRGGEGPRARGVHCDLRAGGLAPAREHVWRHRGRVIETVALAPVLGDAGEGYRTYSRKTRSPRIRRAAGQWTP